MVKKEEGQSLFEVVFAIAVASLIITGIVTVVTASLRNSEFSRNNALANRYAQEGQEWLRGQRDLDWAAFASHAGANTWYLCSPTTWTTSSCTITNVAFSRRAVLTAVNPSTITATVTVSWSESQGTQEVVLITVYTDWKR